MYNRIASLKKYYLYYSWRSKIYKESLSEYKKDLCFEQILPVTRKNDF